MSAETYREKLAKSLATFLGRWNGGEARLWEYSASHSSLIIRITRKGQSGNLHLCLGVESIHAPVLRWENCRIEVRDDGKGYTLLDKGAGVEIKAENIEVKENVKPVY